MSFSTVCQVCGQPGSNLYTSMCLDCQRADWERCDRLAARQGEDWQSRALRAEGERDSAISRRLQLLREVALCTGRTFVPPERCTDADVVLDAVNTLRQERDAARAELEDARKKAFEGWAHAGQVQEERDAALRNVATLREALEEISEKLQCEGPCPPTYRSCECGKTKELWCAGCVARAALSQTSAGGGPDACPVGCSHETFHYCGSSGTHCDKHCACSCGLCAATGQRGDDEAEAMARGLMAESRSEKREPITKKRDEAGGGEEEKPCE